MTSTAPAAPAPPASAPEIASAVSALGPGPLTEEGLVRHIHPLFSRVLQRQEIYLSNHSLGRPLDREEQLLLHGEARVRLLPQRLDGRPETGARRHE